jgi:hypothetical protein
MAPSSAPVGAALSGTKTSVTYPAQDMGNTMLVGRWLDLQTAKASPRGIREELILKVLAKEDSVVELAEQYGVSRQPQDHLQVAVAI